MNASRPEAKIEDSTRAVPQNRPGWVGWVPTGLGFAGAVGLIVAQFTPLYAIETIARHPLVVRTVRTGSHHGWALLPVAALALLCSVLMRRAAGRATLLALGLLGLTALGVTVLVDLPGVHSTGIVGNPVSGLRAAQAQVGVGIYLETPGAALLLVAAATGTALTSTRRAPARRSVSHTEVDL